MQHVNVDEGDVLSNAQPDSLSPLAPRFPSSSSRRILQRATSLVRASGEPHSAVNAGLSRTKSVATASPRTKEDNNIGSTIKSFVKTRGSVLRPKGKSQPESRPHPETHKRALSEPSVIQIPDRTAAYQRPIIETPRTYDDTTYTEYLSPIVKISRSTSDMDPNYSDASASDNILPLPEGSTEEVYEVVEEIKIPTLLEKGTPMIKINKKGVKPRVFRLDAEQGQIIWESKKGYIVNIENIREMRTGANARNYREMMKMSIEYEPRWMTIIYLCDGKYKTLHVVALSLDVFKMWLSTLHQLYSLRRELMSGLGNMERRELVWQKQYWKAADSTGDQKLDFDEVLKMCQRLNINSDPKDLRTKFDDADTDRDGFLTFADFQKFVKLLKARPDLRELFQQYAPNGAMECIAFENFMREIQKADAKKEDIQRLFLKYAKRSPDQPPEPSNSATSPSGVTPQSTPQPEAVIPATPASPSPPVTMSLEGFSSFLLSSDNTPWCEQQGKIHHDMSRPICEYYISASHNTYLVGNQLVGDSTTEGYIRALLQGCRSVELDIWDGDKEPCVYHGKTLTSKVSVREVAQAIAKYAFVASPFPVIISAEIHCKIEQQDMVAQIMKEEFGDTLVTDHLPGREHEKERGVSELPSPNDLRGRILLKAKKLFVSENTPIEAKAITVDAESSTTETTTSSTSDAEGGGGGAFSRAKHLVSKVKQKAPRLLRGSSSSQHGNPAERPKISTQLAGLLVYTVGVKCRGINKKEIYDPVHLFSLSERTANKLMKLSMMDIIKHNRTHVVRIYPNGTRLKSSNYEPHRYWAAGAQLCAINWQTFDLGYMINYAMFQRNGGSGFVLKPEPLRVKDKQSLGNRTKHFLDVTIVSAQQLPRPKDSRGHEIVNRSILDPFVEVSLHIPDWTSAPFLPTGVESNQVAYSPATSATKTDSLTTGASSSARTISLRTSVIKNNGFNPVWNQRVSIPFDLVGGMKDLVFVRFDVREKGEDEEHPIGVFCASLGSLKMAGALTGGAVYYTFSHSFEGRTRTLQDRLHDLSSELRAPGVHAPSPASDRVVYSPFRQLLKERWNEEIAHGISSLENFEIPWNSIKERAVQLADRLRTSPTSP
ncbi:Phospholipase C [Tulasnella sp. 403]|nr:Phospholipase C [Tulasnella sp. 403]